MLTRQPKGTTTVLGATGISLAIALAIQLVSGHLGAMYGDIGSLYDRWGIRPHSLPYLDRRVEYPVVIGYVAWAATWLAHSATTFLGANALVLAPLALGTTLLLHRRNPSRTLLFAAAPTLALYAFHNWDLVPVAACVAGLVAHERRRPALAGALLTVGAWAKVYPGFVLVALVVLAVERRAWREATRLLASTVAVTLALNLPVLLSSSSGWWYPFRMQGHRRATWGSLWFHVIRLPGLAHLGLDTARLANLVSFAGLGIGLIAVLLLARRVQAEPMAVAASVVVVFLLTDKVFSPQYTLWLVPFFVLLPLPRRLWVALMALDVAMYAVVFAHLDGGHKLGLPLRSELVAWIAVARAVVLVLVLLAALHPSATDGRAIMTAWPNRDRRDDARSSSVRRPPPLRQPAPGPRGRPPAPPAPRPPDRRRRAPTASPRS